MDRLRSCYQSVYSYGMAGLKDIMLAGRLAGFMHGISSVVAGRAVLLIMTVLGWAER